MAHAKTFDGMQDTKMSKMEIGSIPEDCDDDGRIPRRNGVILLLPLLASVNNSNLDLEN